MAGERRADADLGGLRVAHLADHDDVGVRAQDRAQAAANVSPIFGVDRDLREAVHPVLDRVLDRDDLALRRR